MYSDCAQFYVKDKIAYQFVHSNKGKYQYQLFN